MPFKLYPKDGKLTVNAFCQEGKAVISIADTGVGISDEDQG